jgi:hypothetical protein
MCHHAFVRRRLPWLIAIPLSVVGTLAGHAVGYRAAVPDAHERADVLSSSGHAYLEYAPLAIALCLALIALGFVAQAIAAFRERDTDRGMQITLVAALAPAAFVLQEFIERYVHDGQLHWELVISAPFLLGLAAQLPFALVAAATALVLGAAALRVAQAIKTASRPRPRGTMITFLSWRSVDLPPEPVLARGYAGRGPPLLA